MRSDSKGGAGNPYEERQGIPYIRTGGTPDRRSVASRLVLALSVVASIEACLMGLTMILAARKCFVLLLAGAVMAASTGIRLVVAPPRGPSAAKADEWYPCKGHGCGCIAEMCRTHCCCETASQPPNCPEGALPDVTIAGSASTKNFHLAIQSSCCAGSDTSWTITSVSWLLQRRLVSLLLDRWPGHLQVNEPISGPLAWVSPDPPPPRS